MDRLLTLAAGVAGSDDAVAGRVGDAAGDAARSTGELLERVPWSTQGVVLALLIGGAVLAVFGRRWMRAGFALLGCLIGAQAGLFLPAAFGFEPAAWLAAVVGGVLGLIAGVLAYRATLIGVMGMAGGVVGAVVSMVLLLAGPGLGPAPGENGDAPDPPAESLVEGDAPDGSAERTQRRLRADPLKLGLLPQSAAREAAEAEAERRGVENARELGDAIERGAADVGRVVARAAETIEPYWAALTTRERAVVVFGGFVGVLGGVAIGMLMSTFAGMLVTAYGGTAIVLWSGVWLINALDAGAGAKVPTGAYTWLGVWLVVGSLCLALRIGRPTKRRSSSDD